MFWKSVGAGLSSLSDWHVLVGMACASLVTLLYPILVGLTTGNGESGARSGAGCLLFMLGGPLMQTVAVSAFVLLCLPAIVDGHGFTPAVAIGPLFWPVFKAGFLAMLFVVAFCFIPVVGGLIINTPGVPVFLQGIFMLKPIIKKLYSTISNQSQLPDTAFPSFLNCVGYIIIGLLFCFIGFFCASLVLEQLKKRRDPLGYLMDQYRTEPSSGAMLFAMFIGPVVGIVPLLMYGRFVGLSLQGQ